MIASLKYTIYHSYILWNIMVLKKFHIYYTTAYTYYIVERLWWIAFYRIYITKQNSPVGAGPKLGVDYNEIW